MKLLVVSCLIAFTAVAAQEKVEEVAYVEDSPDVAAASAQKAIEQATSEFVQTPDNSVAQERLILPRCYLQSKICPTVYQPVCGYSFCFGLRTFSNLCEFNSYNRCNYNGYRFLAYTSCEKLYRRCYRKQFYFPIYELDAASNGDVKSVE